MRIKLKDFQEDAVENLVLQIRTAAWESKTTPQAIILSSPTGSGKTIIATASIERIIQGDIEFGPSENAVFLWLSDQPEINLQTRRKMLQTSSILDNSRLQIIESNFDQETFLPGKVHFLNIQKLGKEKQLVTHGDDRLYTIWETITNTIITFPETFFLFIDEAHRGMSKSRKDIHLAETIVQKFIKGSEGEIPPVPIIIGISATPERFDHTIQGTNRVSRRVPVPIEGVRDSGLLKDTIKLYYPSINQPTDITMLQAATRSWQEYIERWINYCESQDEQAIKPIFVVQVQDGTKGKISRTDISEAIDSINEIAGPFPFDALAHSFQEGTEIICGSNVIRYLSPADISSDPDVKIVFFKTSLNTGWDCPSAEVMMSFRRAIDATSIAQLVGRMVRTPLARRIEGDEFLNSVALYLPHYDEQGLKRVVDKLTNPDAEYMPPVDIVRGKELVTLFKNKEGFHAFNSLEELPSYIIPKRRKIAGVRRLMKLARLLANDDIQGDAVDNARDEMLCVLAKEFNRIRTTRDFQTIVESRGKVIIKSINWEITSKLTPGETIEIDIANENVEDLFSTAGRKFGEGLHKTWWRSRVEQGEEWKTLGKLEAIALSMNPEVLLKLENKAQQRTREWLAKYRMDINRLSESRKQLYNEVRKLASQPEIVTPVYPDAIEVKMGSNLLPKHLYVDENSNFPVDLNNWEKTVILEELGEACSWLRNIDRKPWSLTIPYKIGGEFKPLFPDFLVLRDTPSGIEIDLLDPHNVNLADAPAKAAGLAQYASEHGPNYGRIEIITINGKKMKRLNLKDEVTREKVKAVVTREHLLQLYNDVV